MAFVMAGKHGARCGPGAVGSADAKTVTGTSRLASSGSLDEMRSVALANVGTVGANVRWMLTLECSGIENGAVGPLETVSDAGAPASSPYELICRASVLPLLMTVMSSSRMSPTVASAPVLVGLTRMSSGSRHVGTFGVMYVSYPVG